MRSEDEIKKKIEEIKQEILGNVLAGIIIKKAIQNDTMWIEALEWVLQEDNNEW